MEADQIAGPIVDRCSSRLVHPSLSQPLILLPNAAARPRRSLRPLRRAHTPHGGPIRPRPRPRRRRAVAVGPRSGPIPASRSLSLPAEWPQWRAPRPIRGAWPGSFRRRGADQTAMWVTPPSITDSVRLQARQDGTPRLESSFLFTHRLCHPSQGLHFTIRAIVTLHVPIYGLWLVHRHRLQSHVLV